MSVKETAKLIFQGTDRSEIRKSLVGLINSEPESWPRVLLLEALPDPVSAKMSIARARLIAETLTESETLAAAGSNRSTLEALAVAFLDLAERKHALERELAQLTVWSQPKASLSVTLSAVIQQQSRLVYEQADRQLRRADDSVDLSNIFTSTIPTQMGGTRIDVSNAWESTVDAIELVLSYVLWLKREEPFGDPHLLNDEENELQLGKAIVLAQYWNILRHIWDSVRYRGYLPTSTEDIVYYGRSAIDSFVLDQIAVTRSQQQYFEFMTMSIGSLRERQLDLEAHERMLQKVSRKQPIALSPATTSLTVSPERLRELFDGDWERMLQLLFSDTRHLNAILAGACTVGNLNVLERDICEVFFYLRLVSALLVRRWHADYGVKNRPGLCDQTFIVLTEELTALIAGASKKDLNQVRAILNVFQFRAGKSELELYDRVLIPVDKERVVIVPALIEGTHPVRFAEHIALEHGGSFSVRSKPFLTALSDLFVKFGAEVALNVIYHDDDGEGEIDLVVFWEHILYVVEAKCLKSTTYASDKHNVEQEIIYGAGQASRGLRWLRGHWTKARERTELFFLPPFLPVEESLVALVITNVTTCTGRTYSSVPVVDDGCLRKFFGASALEVFRISERGNEHVGTTVRYRPDGPPKSGDFRRYISNVPQVKFIAQRLSVNWEVCGPVKTGEGKAFAFPMCEFKLGVPEHFFETK